MTAASIKPQTDPVPPSMNSGETVPAAAIGFLGTQFPEYRHKHVWSRGDDHHFRINRYAERIPEDGGISEIYIADSKHVVLKVIGDRVEYEDRTLN